MPKQRRAVIVGTGAGGLAAAAYLAKDGFDVVALDQADRIGGFLAPFSLDGYTFDPGLHYVGQAHRGQLLDRALGGLGLDLERLLVEMDPDGFDVYRFPGVEVRRCRGLERYRDRLIERFPAERDGLHRLFDIVAHFAEASRSWPLAVYPRRLSDLRGLRHLPFVLRWLRSSFSDVLEHALQDPRLRAVIAAPIGDLGLPPSRLSALAGLALLAHYADGAFFPRGGAGALRDALVESAARHGARFRTGADVVEILVKGSVVIGVKLTGGEQLEADIVISDADPTITFGTLLARAALPERLVRKVERMQPSLGTFTVYLGMARDLRAHGLGAFNVWHYPSWDLEALYGAALAGQIPDELPLFLSSGTARDDSGRLAPEGCSTLQIVAFVPWQPFARWASLRPDERGADYRRFRQELADRMLVQLDRAWPGLVGDVVVQRIGTPLSNTDYTRAVQGGAYGPAHTSDQLGPWRFGTRTPIQGLLLAGAGVTGAGVAPCLLSGRRAAMLAAGRRTRLGRAVAGLVPELAPAGHRS